MSGSLEFGCLQCHEIWDDWFSTHNSGNINGDHEKLTHWMRDHSRKCEKATFVIVPPFEEPEELEEFWKRYKKQTEE